MAEALRLARSKGMLRTQEQEEQRHGRTNDMKAQRTQEKDEVKAEQLRQQGGPTPPPPLPPRPVTCRATAPIRLTIMLSVIVRISLTITFPV